MEHNKWKTRILLDTPEERRAFAEKFCQAAVDDDDEVMNEMWPLIQPGVGLMLAIKTLSGADHIREAGYDTTLVDEVFGPGWLDKENSELHQKLFES